MGIKYVALLAVLCMALSITAAYAVTVDMRPDALPAGWSTIINVDNSGRGGIYVKDPPYGGSPTSTLMFTNGSRDKVSSPWSAVTTNNYNGVWLSQFTSMNIRCSGFEGMDANNFQTPHYVLSFKTPTGNTRCAEWQPWTDGIARNPGNSIDGKFATYNALVDGSWYVAWMGARYSTFADMIAAIGDCQIGPTTGYGTAWHGQAFSVGYANYDNSVAIYNSDARGLVEWFDVGVNGVTTTFVVPEPGSILALATGLIGFLGLRKRR